MSSQAGASAFDRLKKLRHELDTTVLPEPWSNVEKWIAKAKPVIRKYCPDDLSDFEDVTAPPQWVSLPRVVQHRDLAGSNRLNEDATKRERSSNAMLARNAKQKILGFLDSLISLAQESIQVSRSTARKQSRREIENVATGQVDQRNVFVVHGRNTNASSALRDFLRRIGLNPLEWSEIVAATGKGSPYVGEVLEQGFRMAQAIVVLMTGDDEARLRKPYRGSKEPKHEIELTPQPRPNVLIEAGMALGLNADRTIIIELGELRPASDLLGRHVIRLNDSPGKRKELAQRLNTAGCAVNLAGDDWLSDKGTPFADAIDGEPTDEETASPEIALHSSDGVLWSFQIVGGQRVYRAHCPQCQTALIRKIDFLDCPKCGFGELLSRREPSTPPA